MTRFDLPGGPGVRVDTHLSTGGVVSPHYDSLVAKLIVHGATRTEALARLRIALSEFAIGGIETNLPLHRRLVDEPEFMVGSVDIHWLEARLKAKAAA